MTVGLTAVLLAGCDEGPSPPARLQQAPGAGWAADSLPAFDHDTMVLGAFAVCLSSPGSAIVSEVRAYGGNVTVSGFAVRPNPFATGGSMIGSAAGRLEDNGLTRGASDVTVVCGPEAVDVNELVVELERVSGETVSAEGLLVRYVSGGETAEMTIPHGLVMCMSMSGCDIPSSPAGS